MISPHPLLIGPGLAESAWPASGDCRTFDRLLGRLLDHLETYLIAERATSCWYISIPPVIPETRYFLDPSAVVWGGGSSDGKEP